MKLVKLDQIVVPACFADTKPKEYKLDKVRRYIKEHGKLDKPILLHGNYLKDGYVRYLVAKELGLEEVECVNNSNVTNNKLIKYVVGKFSDNGKEYIWKVPPHVKANIKAGDMVWVQVGNNKQAYTTVIKVDITEDTEFLKHKNVISKYRKKVN